MENYEKLSFIFKKLLKRIKTMRLRLKELTKTMNENKSKSFIKSDEYVEIQVEFDCINVGIGYLNIEIKRIIIMLKICSYKQRVGKSVSITEPNIVIPLAETFKNTISETSTISSVDQNNNFDNVNKRENKSVLISIFRDSMKRTNQERNTRNISPIHYPRQPKLKKITTVDSINDTTTKKEFKNQESTVIFKKLLIMGFEGNFVGAVYIQTFFCILLNYCKIPELKKINCKIKG